jgi:hypothetical protein
MLKKIISWLKLVRTTKSIAITLSTLLLFVLIASSVACSVTPTTEFTLNQKPILAQPSVQSSFKVLSLAISPPKASKGQPVNISADIINSSSNGENYPAELRINNATEAVKTLTIPLGTTHRINFIVYKDKPGNYSVTFGDLDGNFTIADQDSVALTSSSNSQPNTTTSSCCGPTQTSSSTNGSSCCNPTTQLSTQNPTQYNIRSGGCCGR